MLAPTSYNEQQASAVLVRLAVIFSGLTVMVGIVSLTGSLSGLTSLTEWGLSPRPLGPWDASLFIVAGSAGLLFAVSPDDKFARKMLFTVGVIATIWGCVGLLVDSLNWQLPGSGLFAEDPIGPAPLVAVGWSVLGLSLAITGLSDRFLGWSAAFAASVLVLSLIVMLGYLYGATVLIGYGERRVSLPAGTGLFTLANACLAMAGPFAYPNSLLFEQTARSKLLRVFVPIILGVIVVDGLLARFMPRGEAGSAAAAVSILIFVSVSLAIVYIATRISGNSIDAAEQVRDRYQNELESSRAMFEALFDNAPGAIVVVNDQGKIERVNHETERMFGYAKDELRGQRIEILIPERYRKRHVRHVDNYQAKPVLRPMGAGLNLYGVRKNGEEFPIDIMLGPMKSSEGAWVLSVIHDVTERRQNEREIAELNRELEQTVQEQIAVNKELESFSYSVSHDLRAPLRAIDGFARILVEDYEDTLDDEGKRVVSVIQSNTRQMGQLIDDLLSFSRLGRKELTRSDIDMQELVQGVVEELKANNRERNIEFQVGSLPEIKGDRAMLRQVVLNLLSNAVKFTSTREKAMISVTAEDGGGDTILRFEDNGVGFDDQYANKLFGVFQRLHRQQDFEGTGVGLAIVQRVIHRHGGRVWAQAELDKGARFFVALPKS